eukprot:scaffold112889_cov19-Tisochrysis_lutea.AAC.3
MVKRIALPGSGQQWTNECKLASIGVRKHATLLTAWEQPRLLQAMLQRKQAKHARPKQANVAST